MIFKVYFVQTMLGNLRIHMEWAHIKLVILLTVSLQQKICFRHPISDPDVPHL